MNYFKILNIPITFDISKEKLNKQKMIQSISSPEKINTINIAYDALKNDFKRGCHIISLSDDSIKIIDLRPDQQFLNQMITLTENKNSKKSQKMIQDEYTNTYARCNLFFNEKDMNNFSYEVIKLKFLENILE